MIKYQDLLLWVAESTVLQTMVYISWVDIKKNRHAGKRTRLTENKQRQ